MWTKVTSNRMEKLTEALLDRLSTPPTDPMKSEWIVVQSPGMRRYLEMEIAKALGVCANVKFFMPQRFINGVLACAFQDGEPLADCESYDLIFAALEAINELWDKKPLHDVRTYLANSTQGHVVTRKELLFADKVAEIFSRYLTFRPEMIVEWDKGKDEGDWQAMLWRAVRKRIKGLHSAELGLRFIKEGDVFGGVKNFLPERVHVFGISSLAPFYLSVVERLSEYVNIHLYVFSPSSEYFGDLRHGLGSNVYEATHPLVLCFGKLSRDLQSLLLDVESRHPFGEEKDLYADFTETLEATDRKPTMLELLQSDMLHLMLPPTPHEVEPDDDSIRIHACPTLMRQVEVLRDDLLHLLNSDVTLQPHEIVVMCPDIEQFSPLIEAVFGEHPDEKRGFPPIPYSIADRDPWKENPFAVLITSLLEVANGRAKASEVLDIISMEIVRDRFRITPDDLARIRYYIKEARIRWGLDEEHKTNILGVKSDECTWRFGLDRLLLGLAVPQGAMFGRVVASDASGSVTSETLQKFYDVLAVLLPTLNRFRVPKTLDVWVEEVAKIIEDFVPHENVEFEQDAQAVFAALKEVEERAQKVGFKRELEPKAFSALLGRCMSQHGGSWGLLTKGITFCKLVPLRNIPFKVVALLGMDDGTFPRKGTEISFDKTAQNPKIGDRNSRDEDLQMFLEAILSARKHLVITYTSLDARTKKPLPPASPVSQLLDILEQTFKVKGQSEAKTAVRKLVYKEHPLQPFSPQNFFHDNPWSFNARYLEASRMLLGGGAKARTPFENPILVKESPKSLTLGQLEDFLVHPQKHFLRFHGFVPTVEDYRLDEDEQVVVEPLQRYLLRDEVLQHLISHAERDKILPKLIRQGDMPIGRIGRAVFDADLAESAETLLEEIKDCLMVEPQKIAGTIQIGDIKLFGELELLNHDYVYWTVGSLKEKRVLRAWVRHLWLLCVGGDYSGNTVLLGLTKREGKRSVQKALLLKPQETPSELLGILVDLYFKGLEFPVPFFVRSSKEVANLPSDQTVIEAPKAWLDLYDPEGPEGLDNDVLFAFGEQENPANIKVPQGFLDFVTVSRLVWSPLNECLKQGGKAR